MLVESAVLYTDGLWATFMFGQPGHNENHLNFGKVSYFWGVFSPISWAKKSKLEFLYFATSSLKTTLFIHIGLILSYLDVSVKGRVAL